MRKTVLCLAVCTVFPFLATVVGSCGGGTIKTESDCAPDCGARVCGPVPNGCGASCGTCADPASCDIPSGQCKDCTPDCSGRECGPDPQNCGTSCGTCLLPDQQCNPDTGRCEGCSPDCGARVCGPVPNGCGESCGSCEDPDSCDVSGGKCMVCTPGRIRIMGTNHPNLWYNQAEIDKLRAIILGSEPATKKAELVDIYNTRAKGQMAADPPVNWFTTEADGCCWNTGTAICELPTCINWRDAYILGLSKGVDNLKAGVSFMIEPTEDKARQIRSALLKYAEHPAWRYSDPQNSGHIVWPLAWIFDLSYHHPGLYSNADKTQIETFFRNIAGEMRNVQQNGFPNMWHLVQEQENTIREGYENWFAFYAGQGVIASLVGNDQTLLDFFTKSQNTQLWYAPTSQGATASNPDPATCNIRDLYQYTNGMVFPSGATWDYYTRDVPCPNARCQDACPCLTYHEFSLSGIYMGLEAAAHNGWNGWNENMVNGKSAMQRAIDWQIQDHPVFAGGGRYPGGRAAFNIRRFYNSDPIIREYFDGANGNKIDERSHMFGDIGRIFVYPMHENGRLSGTCDSPPRPVCVDSSVLRTFAAQGTCSEAGQCSYPAQDETCSDGCDAAIGQCKSAAEFSTCGNRICKNGIPWEWRGTNKMSVFGGSPSDVKSWGMDIVREGVDMKLTSLDRLQAMADDARDNDMVVIFAGFWYDSDAFSGGTVPYPQCMLYGVVPSQDARFSAVQARWREIAARFKDNPHVWFDPWNEPYHWQNLNYSDEQWLIDAALLVDNIRSTGATNIVLLTGENMGQGWENFIRIGPEFLAGRVNVSFDIHAYNNLWNIPTADVESRFLNLLDAGVPFLVGEFGNNGSEVYTNIISAVTNKRITAMPWVWHQLTDDPTFVAAIRAWAAGARNQ